MTRVNRIASNKPKLDMVLLCIPSHFGLVKFCWELFDLDECGLMWLSSGSAIRLSSRTWDFYYHFSIVLSHPINCRNSRRRMFHVLQETLIEEAR